MSQNSIKQAERETIQIHRLIFHILIQGEDAPRFLEEATLSDSVKDFFRQRVQDACEGTQFMFVDEEDGQPKLVERTVQRMLADEDNYFEIGSKILATAFLQKHNKSTSDGLFLITNLSLVRNGSTTNLIALMKFDHSRVLQFYTQGTTAVLKEIQNTFVEDKNAMQKTAVIDVGNVYGWDVTAKERRTREGVADYFREFLGVQVRNNAFILTKKAIKSVKDWFKHSLDTDRAPSENLSSYKARASQYCLTHNFFDTNDFINTVIYDDQQVRKERCSAALRVVMEGLGIAGQEFKPDNKALSEVDKSTAKSSRNVRVIWQGNAETRGIRFVKSSESESGKHELIIMSDEPFEQE